MDPMGTGHDPLGSAEYTLGTAGLRKASAV